MTFTGDKVGLVALAERVKFRASLPPLWIDLVGRVSWDLSARTIGSSLPKNKTKSEFRGSQETYSPVRHLTAPRRHPRRTSTLALLSRSAFSLSVLLPSPHPL